MARKKPFKIEWTAREYEHKERSQDWFWAMGILAFAVALTSIILGNIIFAFLVIVATFALSLFLNRPPENIAVVVNERGVTREKIYYPYESLISFWIDDDHPHKKVFLRSKKLFMPLIIIPLADDLDLDKLHDYLSENLKEEFHSLPFVERILEYLGF